MGRAIAQPDALAECDRSRPYHRSMIPFIIAEIAQGHEGKPEQAALMIASAASAGAQGVKFQLVYADELATPDYEHYKLFQSLEMSDEDWRRLSQVGRKRGLSIYFDVFGSRSLDLAAQLGVDGIKIHSTDMLNPDLLAGVARSSVGEVLLSAGGC